MLDIRKKVASMKLKTGINVIDTNSDGVSLLASVSSGEIHNWIIKDAAGKELPQHVTQSAGPAIAERKRRCYICYQTRDRIVCWIVPCDSGPFRIPPP